MNSYYFMLILANEAFSLLDLQSSVCLMHMEIPRPEF